MSEPTDPGIWADPEPKHKKPEEPIVVNVINDGSPSEFEDVNRAFDKLAKSFNKAGQAMAGFAGIHPGQQIGRITRNQDMTKGKSLDFVVFDELESILSPQKKQEELKPTTLAKAVSPHLNNLCQEVELPKRHLTPEQHMEFIRGMMSADAAAVKNLYYQEPQPQGPINTTPAGSHIPRVVVEVEGRKPHIQQFVDIVRKTNGKA